MAGFKQNVAACGGLLLTAMTGWLAAAENEPPLPTDAAVPASSELIPLPVPDGLPSPPPSVYTGAAAVPQDYLPCPPAPIYKHERCRAKYWGYPEEFQSPPLSARVTAFQVAQIAQGQAARMMLYEYDFLPSSDQLNARGKRRLAKIAVWLPMNGFPVVVEPALASPELGELRRQRVWYELAAAPCPIPSERVILGYPRFRSMDAAEALLLERNRLGLTLSRGASSDGGGSSGPDESDNTTLPNN